AQFHERTGKIFRQGRQNCNLFPLGMLDCETPGVQCEAAESVSIAEKSIDVAFAVANVADYVVAQMFEMAADLMQSSSARLRLDECPAIGMGQRLQCPHLPYPLP